MTKKIVITIDGTAGSGKGTIASLLAKKLNIPYFSTGNMYRALALKCLRLKLDPTDERVANKIAENTKIDVSYQNQTLEIFLDNENVTNFLHTDEVSDYASKISVHRIIREKMVELQRKAALNGSVIMEGRDIGSVVLPDADIKFYLDAKVEVRAERRYKQLCAKGINITYEQVLEDMKERDFRDKTREISPLVIPKNAIVVDCSYLTIDEVVEKFISYIGELWCIG